uniref:Junctional adhesion molecule A n=1 Tax=Esox lucius TaxID=8010 RepID=A0A3P9AGG1_ESOLU
MSYSGLVSVILFFHATGVEAFDVTTSNPNVKVKENQGADLTCKYTADFGIGARVEWKFRDMAGSQIYVIFDGKPTAQYASRVTVSSGLLRFSSVTRKDNGEYNCEVSGNQQFKEVTVTLTVLVPPAVPICRVPSTATTGRMVLLSCHDPEGSPPPTYTWFKDKTPLPADPSQFPAFSNYTYKLNTANSHLEYPSISLMDTGDYYCQSENEAGPPQVCAPLRMVVRDVNVGGIVAGVIVALLAIVLLFLALWYAHRKGYLPRKTKGKPKPSVVYQPASEHGDEGDGEFRQKSSFVV